MRTLALLLAGGLLLAGCSSDADGDPGVATPAADPTSSPGSSEASPTRTITPVPLPPDPPPSGTLIADLEQSSRDVALGRFQVWLDNDTTQDVVPVSITYRDGRYRTALPAERLREMPAQARRGFPVTEPSRPACGSDATSGEVTVVYRVGGRRRTTTVPVEDEADVVARRTAARCLELAAARVTGLRWGRGVSDAGELTLVVTPTGRSGSTLTVESVTGNPVLSPGTGGSWSPDLRIAGDGSPQRVAVPIEPTRCDAHAFGESGSFADFDLNVRLDTPSGSQTGQFTLSLSQAGARHALAWAEAACGRLTTLDSP